MMSASQEYAQAAGESLMKDAPVIDFDKFINKIFKTVVSAYGCQIYLARGHITI